MSILPYFYHVEDLSPSLPMIGGWARHGSTSFIQLSVKLAWLDYEQWGLDKYLNFWLIAKYKSLVFSDLCSHIVYCSLLLSSLWFSRTGSASDWCELQEAQYKCIDTIQYNTIQYNTIQYVVSDRNIEENIPKRFRFRGVLHWIRSCVPTFLGIQNNGSFTSGIKSVTPPKYDHGVGDSETFYCWKSSPEREK